MERERRSFRRRLTGGGRGACLVHLTLSLAATLVALAPAGAQQLLYDRVPKVIVVGIDGVRPDVLRAAHTPVMNQLIASGAFSERARTGVPTLSGPSWASMLTGVWREKHRIMDNSFPFPDHQLDRFPDFLTRIEMMQPDLRTFAVADWPPLMEPQVRDDTITSPPVLGTAIDVRVSLDGGAIGWAAADERSVDAAVAEIRDNNPGALFVYLGNPDEVSHHTGSIEDEYVASIGRADRHIGRLLEAIRGRPTYDAEDWLIIISTDHGRRADGGHGGNTELERNIFFIAHGARVERGTILTPPRIVDVAATALRYLGIGPYPEWEMDGQPVALIR